MKCAIAITILFLSLPNVAEARSNRVGQVPHGAAFGCDICHTSAGGLTDFGFDSFTYTTNGNVSWADLAMKDSDGDGYSNGLELGDPNGSWRTGNAQPGGNYTDPNDADDNFCGDGTLQPNEECEGSNLQGETCGGLGLGTGNLTCTNRCVYNVASCGGCGNDVKQNDEECDGRDLGGATCDMLGFEGGSISCGTNCRLITSACTGTGPATGALCGNSTIDVGESCDGSDMGSTTCLTLGYSGGFLRCSDTCTFDVAACTNFSSSPSDTTPGSNQTPVQSPAGLTPAAADGETISFEGRACSSVGTDASILMLIFAVFFRRR